MKRKLIYGLLAILISFGLWLYVVTVVNPEWEDTFYNIPVVLENEDILMERGLMLVSDEKPTVTLRLSGNRTDMIKLNSSNITIKADLSRIYSAGEQSLNYQIIYPGDVPNNAFKIVSQTPQQLSLDIVEWKSKEVDVQVDTMDTEVPPQYIALKAEEILDYKKISISGPSDIIDRVAVAKIQVNLNDQKETISRQYDYILYDTDGNVVESDSIKANTDKIQYTLKIQKKKEIALRVDVIDGGGLKEENCIITQSVKSITVVGSEKLLGELPDELLVGTIELSDVLKNETYSWKIELPEGITNLSGIENVDVAIEIPPDLETWDISASNIKKINMPEGLDASFGTTQVISVKLRGPKEAASAVLSTDLEIHVDFADATKGSATYKAKIVVTNPLWSGLVGAVGAYSIEATVIAIAG